MDTEQWEPRELPIVGGQLALDFANTVDDPEGPERWDHIATVDGLLHWADRVGLAHRIAPAEERWAAGLHRAHELRDVLNAVLGAIADDRPVPNGDWLRLRAFVASAIAEADLVLRAPGAPHAFD